MRVCERACDCVRVNVCECGLGLWVCSLSIFFSFPLVGSRAYAGVRAA